MRTHAMRFALLPAAMLLAASVLAAEGAEVQPAPSGQEDNEILTDGTTAVAMPGEDSPVTQSTEGNTAVIDFTEGPTGQVDSIDKLDPADTTIIFEPAPEPSNDSTPADDE